MLGQYPDSLAITGGDAQLLTSVSYYQRVTKKPPGMVAEACLSMWPVGGSAELRKQAFQVTCLTKLIFRKIEDGGSWG